jgi:hypothetical protein
MDINELYWGGGHVGSFEEEKGPLKVNILRD